MGGDSGTEIQCARRDVDVMVRRILSEKEWDVHVMGEGEMEGRVVVWVLRGAGYGAERMEGGMEFE